MGLLTALFRLVAAAVVAMALLALSPAAMASNTSLESPHATATGVIGKLSAVSVPMRGQSTCDCDRDGCGHNAGCDGSSCGPAGCCAAGAVIGAGALFPPEAPPGPAAPSGDGVSVGIGADTPLEPPRSAG